MLDEIPIIFHHTIQGFTMVYGSVGCFLSLMDGVGSPHSSSCPPGSLSLSSVPAGPLFHRNELRCQGCLQRPPKTQFMVPVHDVKVALS